MRALFHSRWQTLRIPFALTSIGQLHQSPPSPILGDWARVKRTVFITLLYPLSARQSTYGFFPTTLFFAKIRHQPSLHTLLWLKTDFRDISQMM